MKSNEEILSELKKELIRIGSTNKRDYDLLKKEDHVFSTTICRRLKLSWREVVAKIGLKPARVLLSHEDMLNALKDEFKRLGSFTKSVYIEKRNKQIFPHPRVLTKHLNMSWAEITEVCGRNYVPKIIAFPNEKTHSFRCGMKVRSVKGWLLPSQLTEN